MKEELERMRRQARGKLILGTGIVVLLALGGLACGILTVVRDADSSLFTKIALPIALGVMLTILGAAFYSALVYTPVTRAYEAAYRQKAVESALTGMSNVVYYPTRGMRYDFLYETELLEPGNRYLCQNYISGDYRGITICQNDAAVLRQHRERKRYITDKICVRGRWSQWKTGALEEGKTYVIARKPMGVSEEEEIVDHRGEMCHASKFRTGDDVFDQAFVCFSTKEKSARALLDDSLRAAIFALREALPGKLMLCFLPDATHAVVSGADQLLQGDPLRTVEEDPGNKVREEFAALKAFADVLLVKKSSE